MARKSKGIWQVILSIISFLLFAEAIFALLVNFSTAIQGVPSVFSTHYVEATSDIGNLKSGQLGQFRTVDLTQLKVGDVVAIRSAYGKDTVDQVQNISTVNGAVEIQLANNSRFMKIYGVQVGVSEGLFANYLRALFAQSGLWLYCQLPLLIVLIIEVSGIVYIIKHKREEEVDTEPELPLWREDAQSEESKTEVEEEPTQSSEEEAQSEAELIAALEEMQAEPQEEAAEEEVVQQPEEPVDVASEDMRPAEEEDAQPEEQAEEAPETPQAEVQAEEATENDSDADIIAEIEQEGFDDDRIIPIILPEGKLIMSIPEIVEYAMKRDGVTLQDGEPIEILSGRFVALKADSEKNEIYFYCEDDKVEKLRQEGCKIDDATEGMNKIAIKDYTSEAILCAFIDNSFLIAETRNLEAALAEARSENEMNEDSAALEEALRLALASNVSKFNKEAIFAFSKELEGTDLIIRKGKRPASIKKNGKTVALVYGVDDEWRIIFKCEPERIEVLKTFYQDLEPARFPKGKLWFVIQSQSNLPESFVKAMLQNSYNIILQQTAHAAAQAALKKQKISANQSDKT